MRVVFRIDEGNFENGFSMTLEIREENNGQIIASNRGRLSPNIQLPELYEKWQKSYHGWGKITRWGKDRTIEVPPQNSNYSDLESQFRQEFIKWLKNSDLIDIIATLSQVVSPDKSPRFFLETNNYDLHKFPWEKWEFLDRNFHSPEVALTLTSFARKHPLQFPVRVLVILGNDEDIDIKTDWDLLRKNLTEKTELVLIEKPTFAQIRAKLNDELWDIIYFAGHSSTDDDHYKTGIWINENTFLSPQQDQFRRCLRTAAQKSLRVAIFNSCDGLGLARLLADFDLRIPHIIVMREPIHDGLAHNFLEHFIISFVNGKPIHEALKEAREALSALEIDDNSFPSASFFPVMFQNPEELPFYFPPKIEKIKLSFWQKLIKFIQKQKYVFLFLICFLLVIIIAVFWPKPPQPTNNQVANNSSSSSSSSSSAQISNDLTLCNNTPDFIECGEKGLINYPITGKSPDEEETGRNAFKNGKYDDAVKSLKTASKKEKDPSVLIALNNATILSDIETGKLKKDKVFTIAVEIPYSKTPEDVSKFLLAGSAWRQEQINKNNDIKLLVLMADDRSDKTRAKTIGEELNKRTDLLGVVGPYASHIASYIIDDYANYKLPLISPTNTATIPSFKKEKPSLNMSYYFRTSSTSDIATKHLVKYLEKNGYTQVIIFYQDGKLFSQSYYERLLANLKSSSIKQLGETIKFEKPELMRKKVNDLAIKYQNIQDKIALIVIPDAYTVAEEVEIKKAIIEANEGRFLIVGANSLEDEEIVKIKNSQYLQKILVTVPFYPSNNNNPQVTNFHNFWTEGKNMRNTSYLCADATQVLFQAISNLITEGKTPTRELIRNAIAHPNFQTEGLTGKISFNGGDRAEQVNYLIKPNCQTNSNCTWELVDKYPE